MNSDYPGYHRDHDPEHPDHGKIVPVLFLNYLDLPAAQREAIHKHVGFGNDRYIEYVSELSPCDEADTWASNISQEIVEAYWKDQCDTNGYKHDLDQFIKDYSLGFDIWLLSQNFDLNVRKILVRVSW